ncbi:MAG: phosphatidate cytidylyltransferase [Sphingobacteriales bacterium]|nr:MAG: phosphatidate cytidylyltransferase [Sphingobacteriales bacterium]
MKKIVFTSLAFSIMLLSSCQIIEGIFKTGLYTGVFIVVLVIGLVIYIISKFRNRS